MILWFSPIPISQNKTTLHVTMLFYHPLTKPTPRSNLLPIKPKQDRTRHQNHPQPSQKRTRPLNAKTLINRTPPKRKHRRHKTPHSNVYRNGTIGVGDAHVHDVNYPRYEDMSCRAQPRKKQERTWAIQCVRVVQPNQSNEGIRRIAPRIMGGRRSSGLGVPDLSLGQ